jgi:hypothetical protein
MPTHSKSRSFFCGFCFLKVKAGNAIV